VNSCVNSSNCSFVNLVYSILLFFLKFLTETSLETVNLNISQKAFFVRRLFKIYIDGY
jgi:hypothetical protein